MKALPSIRGNADIAAKAIRHGAIDAANLGGEQGRFRFPRFRRRETYLST